MKYTLILSGSGGQGVMSAGMTLAASAVGAGGCATFLPLYGPAQRGGAARCTVILSDREILSPLPGKCAGLVAMNDASCKKYQGELLPGGTLLVDSGRVEEQGIREDVKLVAVPGEETARELGDVRVANIVLLGALLGHGEILPPQVLRGGLERRFARKSPRVLERNLAALERGVALGKTGERARRPGEAKKSAVSRYSFETTTVGEMLDTPAIRGLIENAFPQVLDHPLLEAGRTFKFADALPYLADMLRGEELESFRRALESLE